MTVEAAEGRRLPAAYGSGQALVKESFSFSSLHGSDTLLGNSLGADIISVSTE